LEIVDVENTIDRIKRILKSVENVLMSDRTYIIFNKMDFFYKKVVNSKVVYNLLEENLRDPTFNLQDYVPELSNEDDTELELYKQSAKNIKKVIMSFNPCRCFKIWCPDLRHKNFEYYDLMMKEARKILYDTLIRDKTDSENPKTVNLSQ